MPDPAGLPDYIASNTVGIARGLIRTTLFFYGLVRLVHGAYRIRGFQPSAWALIVNVPLAMIASSPLAASSV